MGPPIGVQAGVGHGAMRGHAMLSAHCNGIFQALRRRPIFRIGRLSVPTLMRRIAVPLGCVLVLLTAPALASESEKGASSPPAAATPPVAPAPPTDAAATPPS